MISEYSRPGEQAGDTDSEDYTSDSEEEESSDQRECQSDGELELTIRSDVQGEMSGLSNRQFNN